MTTANDDPDMTPMLKRLGLIVVFLWFLFGGVAHFALTEMEMRIVPPAMPWPRAAVLISGVFELLGAHRPAAFSGRAARTYPLEHREAPRQSIARRQLARYILGSRHAERT
jgi:hypothetical protein